MSAAMLWLPAGQVLGFREAIYKFWEGKISFSACLKGNFSVNNTVIRGTKKCVKLPTNSPLGYGPGW